MLKRLFDIVWSFAGILILSPLMAIIALAIVAESKGGIFYFQTRVGRNNVDFKLIKFRTMAPNSDKKGLLTVGNNDSRISRVGSFLRRYKLDELPQLFNVLMGDMSLVGPRPEVRKYVDLYNKEQLKVLEVRPGITDYASLEYFDENEVLAKATDAEKTYIEEIMPHKLELNQKYLANPGLQHDIKLIAKTISRIIK